MIRQFEGKTLFSGKGEVLNLLLPVFFLIMSGLEILFNVNYLKSMSTFQISILANIILLNITHNAFTLVLLTSTDSMQTWINHHGGPKKFWISQMSIIVLLTIFFSQLIYLTTREPLAILVFALIGFIFAVHHAISQSFGLSLVYSRHFKTGEAQTILSKERTLFKLFLFLNLAAGAFFMINQFKYLVFENNLIVTGRYIVFGMIVLIALLLCSLPYYTLKKEGIPKSIFNLRYLLWPLTPFSTVAVFATLVVHGVEYGQVIDKMFKKTPLKKPYLALTLVMIVIIFAYFRLEGMWGIKKNPHSGLGVYVAIGFSLAVSFHHYYLDRKIFRMRKAINRELVAPMLFDNDPTDGNKNV